ncbi:MAG: transketolase [Bacteroidetes bacterium]|nr:MAG: transketolase [Bacteroidota bacterium]
MLEEKVSKKEENTSVNEAKFSFDQFKESVINDYKTAVISRKTSLLGRREVLTGKAKFGIFGDGKEVAQIALARSFKKGDFRSGYYRDQTLAFALGITTVQEYFAQLYAHADVEADPASGGRQMNSHFATRSIDENGEWNNLMAMYNSSADGSPTACQMPRMLGLAQASKMYRLNKDLHQFDQFSNKGNEVVFGTIGDASTSEGLFWETVNAVGVLQVPLALSVWDDGYGISVPKKYQTTKESISTILQGFQHEKGSNGINIYTAKAWNYAELCETYEKGVAITREQHIPSLYHIQDVTQPQGHSTSGSHERYKSPERLQWEEDFDCIKKMREWMLESAIATAEQIDKVENEAKEHVNESKKKAWAEYTKPIKEEIHVVSSLVENITKQSSNANFINKAKDELLAIREPFRGDAMAAINKILSITRSEPSTERQALVEWYKNAKKDNHERFSTHLYCEGENSALEIPEVEPIFDNNSPEINGSEVLVANFDALLKKEPKMLAFGEDLGKVGGVNQGFAGLQDKYGELRVSDTGIREATIIGQGIGLALRGLKPIAEIQYLDYLLYGFQILSDDLATLHYRTKGGQKAPMIVRTRGHRLEGIWHTGSPMGMMLNALRGIYILVPRNMTKAAGFYNTMMQSDDPAIIVECLNGYRLKEKLPKNVGEFTTPLGIPEVIHEGTDITLVTYGSCCRIAQAGLKLLNEVGISCEIIDVQSLLPFDIAGQISESIKKTNKVVFFDEDVPGGASAYMLQEVLEKQGAYQYLDAAPKTITAKPHRAAYGTDGDYFSKPNAEDVFQGIYELMSEYEPSKFPSLF